MSFDVLTVTQLNTYIKSVVDGDNNLNNVYLEGEISNFKSHYSSGHLYFSLKDSNSIIKCVMFNRAASRLKFMPDNSIKVICRGRVSVYDRDGQYQLYVEDMHPTGDGALALAYEQLKAKLQNEGLFAADTKRQIPQNPKRIAVLTSDTGAAIEDIISVTGRRNPAVELVICPVLVQGSAAAESMINMLEKVYSAGGIDLIIIGRGGGSLEDLFCFNDEALVRKLYESPVPVISAVGHETDFTLCDFVADLRAPTPSVAAELAVPDISVRIDRLTECKKRLSNAAINFINYSEQRYDRCISSYVFINPSKITNSYFVQFKAAFSALYSAVQNNYSANAAEFAKLSSKLEALNPAGVFARGYSALYKDGSTVSDISMLNVGDNVKVKLLGGSAECLVNSIDKEN